MFRRTSKASQYRNCTIWTSIELLYYLDPHGMNVLPFIICSVTLYSRVFQPANHCNKHLRISQLSLASTSFAISASKIHVSGYLPRYSPLFTALPCVVHWGLFRSYASHVGCTFLSSRIKSLWRRYFSPWFGVIQATIQLLAMAHSALSVFFPTSILINSFSLNKLILNFPLIIEPFNDI